MVKKFILLFIISFSFSWQINLFSMNENNKIEEIQSSTECIKCSSELEFFCEGPMSIRYTCSNNKCGQKYVIWKVINTQSNTSKKDDKEELNKNYHNNSSNEADNNTGKLVPKKLHKENLIRTFILSKLKYLVPAAVICLAVWKYHSQIKKFLFRK